jgi:bacteriocin biosynthesis cyclodehydratase domain-containing protein
MTPFLSPDPGSPMEPPHAFHVLLDGRVGDRCARLLAEAGVPVTVGTVLEPVSSIVRPDVVIVLATDRPRPQAALRLDAAAWDAGAPWTSGTLVAHEFRVGPSIVPGRTPCFECWSRRVRSLAPDIAAHDALEALAGDDSPDRWFRGRLGPLTEQVAALLAAEAIALSMRVGAPAQDGPRAGLVWEGDAVSGALRVRRFLSIAACSRCSVRDQSGRSLSDYFDKHPLAAHAGLMSERRPQ